MAGTCSASSSLYNAGPGTLSLIILVMLSDVKPYNLTWLRAETQRGTGRDPRHAVKLKAFLKCLSQDFNFSIGISVASGCSGCNCNPPGRRKNI